MIRRTFFKVAAASVVATVAGFYGTRKEEIKLPKITPPKPMCMTYTCAYVGGNGLGKTMDWSTER